MTSRWPSVVSMPAFAPLRSSSALVATVVPWTMKSVAASSERGSVPSSAARRSRPSMTPMDGSSGVEVDLAIVTRPSWSTATRSVKVPPTSIPMRYISAAPSLRAAQPVPPSDEAVLAIGGASVSPALGGFAPAAASGRHDVEDGARRNGDPHLLGLQHPPLASRHHDVAVGQSVLAAEETVGWVPHPVARGVALGELRRLHAECQLRAQAAAEPAVTGGVGPELVTLEEEREARLRDLHAAELDPSRGLALAGGFPAVACGGGAAAAASVEEVPDERSMVRARVFARDGDPEAARPAGHRALRASSGERLDDGLGDLLGAVVGGERHRRRRERPDDGALLRLDLDGSKGALVFRDARIDQVRESHVHRGARVRVRGVHEPDDLRIALGQVHDQRITLFRHRGADPDVLDAVAVVVENGKPAVDAVLPGADAGAALALGAVEDLAHGRRRRLDAVLLDQLEEAPLAHSRRA